MIKQVTLKPLVAVSACLLGEKVRYDGKDKYSALIATELAKYCHLVAVCPEVAIGLGIPRPKIRLLQVGTGIRVRQEDNPAFDVTDQLIDFSQQFTQQQPLSGLVLQDKSPSCGIDNSKLFSSAGVLTGLSSGLFAATIQQLNPSLVMIPASQLQTQVDVLCFIKKLSLKVSL